MEEIENLDMKKQNIKLYSIYKMISWDLLFYYAIIFIFLTQVKGISPAQVLLADAFYPLFKFIFQIPCTSLIDKIGKRNALIIGNIFITIQIILYIISYNFTLIVIACLCSAIGYVIKGLCETNILYDSLSGFSNRPERFSKLDGKATSLYYYANAVSSIASGFLYIINGYLPMLMCLAICFFSTIMSFKFTEIHEVKFKKSNIDDVKEYLKSLRYSFRYILKSNRLRSLIIFYSILCGIFAISITLSSSLLADLQVPEQYFGLIFCILNLLAGFSAKKQEWFHNTFGNKTLAFIGLPTIFSFIAVGMTILIKLPFNITLIIILIMFALQKLLTGPFYTLNKRYLNNFTNSSSRTKVLSLATLVESVIRTLLCLFASFLIDRTNTAYTFVIIGCIFSLVLIALLDYMKTRVGLQPEQYKKEEIDFLQMK